MADEALFELTSRPIEIVQLKAGLSEAGAGACATFEGWVRNRNDGRDVHALEYEAHEGIARAEGERIVREALERFDVMAVRAVHRTGYLEIGDCAVWVGVSAGHRGAAFDACRFIIDALKDRVPIWKKEHYVGGAAGWVNAATGAARD